MTETQRRIKAYQKALPELRERVIAVALLLAMSASMLSTASFAWLTLSRNPEVTNVSTNIAANGNLEIALATSSNAPAESQVGDSSATVGKENATVASNVTWGNLVNLSDPAYGLQYLALRPAQLNTAGLKDKPLLGAAYSADGRIIKLDSDFGYTSWVPNESLATKGSFMKSDALGVRAISSMKTSAEGQAAVLLEIMKSTSDLNIAAGSSYKALAGKEAYMNSLATMMGLYMTATMNTDASLTNPTCSKEDLQNLAAMYADFKLCMEEEAEAIAMMINMTRYFKLLSSTGGTTQTWKEYLAQSAISGQTILSDSSITTSSLAKEGITVSKLTDFRNDYNHIKNDGNTLRNLVDSGGSLAWKDCGLNVIVGHLVNVGQCTIGSDNKKIGSLGATDALEYMKGTQEARITNGILYNFEERTGFYLEVKNLSIKATVKRDILPFPVSASVKANIQTTAPRDYNLFNNDMEANRAGVADKLPVDYVAQDTYGLAVDLWVRTNALNSYLTLEGNVLTKETEVDAMGTDNNGKEVRLYTVTRNIDGNDEAIDVYSVVTKGTSENGTAAEEVTTWYNALTHQVFELADGETPVPKKTIEYEVIGFEGENRIWNGNETMLSTDASTQGSGSCYVYYADTPDAMMRSLRLLEAFKVAFIDGEGHLLGKAKMDTEHYFAQTGRVTVPLIMDPSESTFIGDDDSGNPQYVITELEENIPTRVSAIVYLDGEKLSNQEVLAAAEIQGQLNIQFGSTTAMEPVRNEKLENEIVDITVNVDKTSFDWTADGNMTATVTLSVLGLEPKNVTGFFMRAVSATQGSREGEMVFTKSSGGQWIGTYTFTSPGNYILRTVRIDGVDYDIGVVTTVPDGEGDFGTNERVDYPEVTVTGYAVTELICEQANNQRHVDVMSVADSTTLDLRLGFGTDDVSKMPKSVQAVYLNEETGAQVTANMTHNGDGSWTGSAKFLSSGYYTLQYVMLDGEYEELPESMWQTADLSLGLRVSVFTNSPTNFTYVPDPVKDENGNIISGVKDKDGKYMEMSAKEKELEMQVRITDNAGDAVMNRTDVHLKYKAGNNYTSNNLTWDGETYYTGKLPTLGPGVWRFDQVLLKTGNHVLDYATTSPTFTVKSLEPPKYVHNSTEETQFARGTDGHAYMDVWLTNATAATVQAIMKKGNETLAPVDGVMGENGMHDGKSCTKFTFKIPRKAEENEEGVWELVQLKLADVYDETGKEYTAENPMIIHVSDNRTEVTSRIYYEFENQVTKSVGLDDTGNAIFKFLEPVPIIAGEYLGLTIKDRAGNPVPNMGPITITMTYNGESSTYGKYTVIKTADDKPLSDTVTLSMTYDSKDQRYEVVGNEKAYFKYAGEYVFDSVSGIDGSTGVTGNEPIIYAYTKAPTVRVESVSPGTSEKFNTTKYVKGSLTPVSNVSNYISNDGFYTVVYMKGSSSYGNWAYTMPSVTLALEGVATGEASLTMINAADTSTSHVFTFADGKATQTIGRSASGIGSQTKYLAGKTVFTTIPVKTAEADFVVELSHPLTIEQAEAPLMLDFTNIPDEIADADRPKTVFSHGSTITVYFPHLTWTETETSSPTYGEFTGWSSSPVRTDYSTNNFNLVFASYVRHKYFTWTKYTRTRSATGSTMAQDMEVNTWSIGNTTYEAGKTYEINITEDMVAVANHTKNGDIYSVGSITTTDMETRYGYVAGSDGQTSTPDGGKKIGEAWGSYPAPKLAANGYYYDGELDYEQAWP